MGRPSFHASDSRRMEAEIIKRLDRIEKYSLLAAKNVLTVEDAALLMGRSPKTIRNIISEIPHYKNGRGVWFKRDEFEAYLCQVKCTPITQLLNQ